MILSFFIFDSKGDLSDQHGDGDDESGYSAEKQELYQRDAETAVHVYAGELAALSASSDAEMIIAFCSQFERAGVLIFSEQAAASFCFLHHFVETVHFVYHTFLREKADPKEIFFSRGLSLDFLLCIVYPQR